MVLDTYEQDEELFIFKNTYGDDNKKITINLADAPEEFFFVHIDIKDMDNLPSQEQRKANKKAEIELKKKRMTVNNKSQSLGTSRASLKRTQSPSSSPVTRKTSKTDK